MALILQMFVMGGGAETVVVMTVGAAVLVAAVVVLSLASGEKSGEGMREIGRAAEATVGRTV